MAADLSPPEVPITAVAAAVTTSNTANITLTEPEVATTATVSMPPAPKRQRRPSVRLGEIGDQSATISYETHHIRRSKPPWRVHKDSSKSVKARSLTNLVNGNDSFENQETDGNNQNGDVILEFGHRKKAKRAKRVRSNWISTKADDDNNSREDEDEGFRDFDQDSDSQLLKDQQQSPVHSNDNNVTWHGHRTSGMGREMDNYPEKCSTSEGVRTWLIELGLSRYASVFEVHEVDDEVLPLLTLEDLKDMGINAVGSRRKLYSAIQKLRKGFS
ncbi:uncharacterized protein LOC126671135 [Mercurialis annua]|uniref:uncharacterized protein LOC126671135 n=1 Tax=Mercurialis annua TaxID=3986 RepID=UPI002160CC46|nr:uncharacterized protein LOC126671135 [Mercurialis annua]